MVGSTVPGDTAWKNGLQPGDKMVQFGKDGRKDDQYRFRDLRFQVIKADVDEPLDILLRRTDGTEEWKTLFPKERKKVNLGLATIGVASAPATKVRDVKLVARTAIEMTDLEAGDTITGVIVNGQEQAIADAFDLKKVLFRNATIPIDVVVERPADPENTTSAVSEVTVNIPPLPTRDYGMRLEPGPVVAVQAGSPAESAGFKKDDLITAIDGEPIEDYLSLDDLLQEKVGSSVTVTVAREGQSVDLTVTPRHRDMLGEAARRGGAISSECLGVAFHIKDTIVSIVPDSPAAKAGLRPGDEILTAEFSVAEDASAEERARIKELKLEKLDFVKFPMSWPALNQLLQTLPEKSVLRLTYLRDGDLATADMLPALSADRFDPDRGIYLDALSRVRTASTVGESVQLGFRETKEGIEQVFMTLRKIGKLKKHLGGPLTIGAAAMSEASQGWPRLFIFLTLLSANLAVLNFLPIPVLDGGHIMFLIYEGVFGKPMPERIAMTATMVGLCFILGLMAYVLGLDFFRFSGLAGG